MNTPDPTQPAYLPPPGTALPPQPAAPAAAAPDAPFDQAPEQTTPAAPAATHTPIEQAAVQEHAAAEQVPAEETPKLETSIEKVGDAIEAFLDSKGASFKVFAQPLLNGLHLPEDPAILDAVLADGARMLLSLRSDGVGLARVEMQDPGPAPAQA